jgi:hypothetical protein
LDRLDEGHIPLTDVTIQEMNMFLCDCADWAQSKGHTETLLVYTRTVLHGGSQIVTRDILFHILRFLHLSDNTNDPNKTDENYD